MERKKHVKVRKMNFSSITERNMRRIMVPIFFAIYLIVGLTAYQDYGISWDEPVSRERGTRSLKYIIQGDRELVDVDWMFHHGAAFEMPLVAMEGIFGLTKDIKSVYLTRHLSTFLLFYTGIIFFYFLGKRSFNSWQAGLLGCVFIVLSPRIFAHSFYNPKDIPFLSLFIVALYTMLIFFDKKTRLNAMFHGLVCALLIDVRIVGAVIPLITIGFLWFDYLTTIRKNDNNKAIVLYVGLSAVVAIILIWSILPDNFLCDYLCGLAGFKSFMANSFILATVIILFFILKSLAINEESRKICVSATVFVVCFTGFTVLFWPALWPNPVGGLIKTFNHTTTFPWPYNVLYMGNYTKADALPWHYLPVWIGISTPLVYCLLFVVGYCRTIISVISEPVPWFLKKRHEFIYLALITAAIGGAILFKPVLYDDWRQMYFIYPVFILIAVGGLWKLFLLCKHPFYKGIVNVIVLIMVTGVCLNLVWIAKTMVAMHPFQNVYFNRLAGSSMVEIKSAYDLDYWGLSYRQALEYIVANDKSESISLYAVNYPAKINVNMLDEKERKRLFFVENLEDATYFLDNFRYRDPNEKYPPGEEYYSIKINGRKIVVVKKMDKVSL